jgi:hypothetical protein
MALTKRAELFNRLVQRGVYDVTSIGQHPGAIFFVSSGHAEASDAAGFGKSPDSPVATIDYAVSLCNSGTGDVIYVMPGHTEDVDGAGALDLDVIGISVIGIGEGTIQPVLEMTDDGATITIDAANITVENFHIVTNSDDVAVIFDVNADDFTLRHCRFRQDAVDMAGTIAVQDAAAGASDRITIEDCHAIMYDAANTNFVIFDGTGTGHIVRRNVLIGAWTDIVIGGAGVVTYASIHDNYISNQDATDDAGINLSDTSPAIVANNRLGYGDAGDATTAINAIVASCLENYVVDIGDRSGVLDPISTTP